MDHVFENAGIVHLLNENFTSYKVTDYTQDWERWLGVFGIKDVPAVFIMNHHKSTVYIVEDHEGYLNTRDLTDIILEAFEDCYD